jgi:Bardet-Biedl syndrome 9 protein
MSVFQLHDWWQIQLGESEDFDFGCIAVGNVDNVYPPCNKVVIGSHQGILRVLKPSSSSYKVEDLLLEVDLGQPILQLALGKLIAGVDIIGLAILHPRSVVVYEVIPQRNKETDDEGSINYYSVQKHYEHNLGINGKNFTSYNMILGRFGGATHQEMLLVQSLDGKLQFFEQSAQAFIRQLSDCLIPHPIVYFPQLDSFMVANYSCHIECYRYQVLATSQKDIEIDSIVNNSDLESTRLTSPNKLRSTLVEWSLNLGENCIQLDKGYFSGSEYSLKYGGEILALCERSIYLIKVIKEILFFISLNCSYRYIFFRHVVVLYNKEN